MCWKFLSSDFRMVQNNNRKTPLSPIPCPHNPPSFISWTAPDSIRTNLTFKGNENFYHITSFSHRLQQEMSNVLTKLRTSDVLVKSGHRKNVKCPAVCLGVTALPLISSHYYHISLTCRPYQHLLANYGISFPFIKITHVSSCLN